jgi:GntR family transcriptional repressor for pyruvate dehydrogenase complex
MAVAQAITDDITDRGYKPGTKLATEKDMVTRFDVGRGTLRESLRFLELNGVIVMKAGPNGGPIVAEPDARDLASLLGLFLQLHATPFSAIVNAREVLEPAIAAMAATHANKRLIDEIKGSVAGMEAFIDDQENFLAENDRFHGAVAAASGNALFSLLISSLHLITDGMPPGVTYPLPRRLVVLRAHKAVLAALEDGDAAAAEAAMRRHVQELRRYAREAFPTVYDSQLRWRDIAP